MSKETVELTSQPKTKAESSTMNPINANMAGAGAATGAAGSAASAARIEKMLHQRPPPIVPSKKRMKGMRSGKHLVKYDHHDLSIYKALLMGSRTILVNMDVSNQ